MAAPKKIGTTGPKPFVEDIYAHPTMRATGRPGGARPKGVAAPSQGHVDAGGVVSRKSMKPGGGGRFEAFVQKLASQGKSPGAARAIAASVGAKKYGRAQMQSWAAKGRKRA